MPDNIKIWPMQEAVGLNKHLINVNENKDKVTFQTGYGPSGLPIWNIWRGYENVNGYAFL